MTQGESHAGPRPATILAPRHGGRHYRRALTGRSEPAVAIISRRLVASTPTRRRPARRSRAGGGTSKRALPDFVIVGAQKAGTSTLYTQSARTRQSFRRCARRCTPSTPRPGRSSGTARSSRGNPRWSCRGPQRRPGSRARRLPSTCSTPRRPSRLHAAVPAGEGGRDPARPGGARGFRIPPRRAHGRRRRARSTSPSIPRTPRSLPDVADTRWYDDPHARRGCAAISPVVATRSSSSGGSRSFRASRCSCSRPEQLDAGTAVARRRPSSSSGSAADGVDPRVGPQRRRRTTPPSPRWSTRLREYFAPHNERLFDLLDADGRGSRCERYFRLLTGAGCRRPRRTRCAGRRSSAGR